MVTDALDSDVSHEREKNDVVLDADEPMDVGGGANEAEAVEKGTNEAIAV